MAQAVEHGFARLRLECDYRTLPEQPMNLHEGLLAQYMHLTCKFHSNLTVEYSCRHFEFDDQGASEEVDCNSGTADYEVVGPSDIRFAFDTGSWVYEINGTVSGEHVKLAFRMEEYLGLQPGLFVVEGEGQLSIEVR